MLKDFFGARLPKRRRLDETHKATIQITIFAAIVMKNQSSDLFASGDSWQKVKKVSGLPIINGFITIQKRLSPLLHLHHNLPHEKFKDHEKSSFHQKNVHLILSRTRAMPINTQLEIGVSKEQRNARKCLLTIISSLRYFMCIGNSVCSHDHSEGNLMELLEERCLDVPELNQWLKRRNKYFSFDIQNELIEIMVHNVLREIVKEVKNSSYFGVIADSTTDAHGMEQFYLCLRFVHPWSLEDNEVFVCLYNPVDSRGKSLASAIQDALHRLNLSLDNLRGHCFDGAANMSGREKGVQKILIDEQAKYIYVHYANHAADLALQEVARKMDGICDIICFVKDSSNVILDS
ncbi:hypothetical protein PR048_008381 [Dryococelus australis]|uniref:DUF4371 domain-containing protein n=1 Tax=Dryococelus australis TaxID=614101 RepID=A0ABQ9HWY8_9NEOP|nr:hypothetical protein PR048_008381 [Dryococelus australis]